MTDRDMQVSSPPLEAGLFSIDAEAELRKLGRGRFKTRGESVAEIVALVVAAGASSVEIDSGRRSLSIAAPDARLEGRMIEELAIALDPRRSAGRRHGALEALEASDGLGLIAPFADKPASVAFEWNAPDGARGIRFDREQPPRKYRPPVSNELKIIIRGRRRDLAKERRVIRRKCRFSPIPVLLNGRKVSRGHVLADCLIQVELPQGESRGAVGIPLEGNLVSITRTSRGVVAEERVWSEASGLVYSAVVETPDRSARDLGSSLEGVARDLYSRLAARHDQTEPAAQGRVRKLLFDRARITGDLLLLDGVHAFPRTKGSPLDLAAVREAASRGDLYAIGDDEPEGLHHDQGRIVLRLEPRARQFLETVAGIPLAAPPRRADGSALETRIGTRLAQLLNRLTGWLLPCPGDVIDNDQLDAKESAFVAAVSAAIDRPAAMVASKRRPSYYRVRGGDGDMLLIGRSHPLVRRMVAAVSDNPAYLSPAVAALTEGERRDRSPRSNPEAV